MHRVISRRQPATGQRSERMRAPGRARRPQALRPFVQNSTPGINQSRPNQTPTRPTCRYQLKQFRSKSAPTIQPSTQQPPSQPAPPLTMGQRMRLLFGGLLARRLLRPGWLFLRDPIPAPVSVGVSVVPRLGQRALVLGIILLRVRVWPVGLKRGVDRAGGEPLAGPAAAGGRVGGERRPGRHGGRRGGGYGGLRRRDRVREGFR